MKLFIAFQLLMGLLQMEALSCEVQPLEDHGFVQLSEHREYVCVNEDDFTDFVIIEDEHSQHEVGDELTVILRWNEVFYVRK